jgi:hypothetical protein
MDFDPRWSDDPPEGDDYASELSQRQPPRDPIRGSATVHARDVFSRDLVLRRGLPSARPDCACRLTFRKLRLEIIDSELRSNGPEPFWSESRETLCRELR